MKDLKGTCKTALVQAEPVMFNKLASLKKALDYIDEAAAHEAELIVFPELFIPGYPIGMNFGFSMGKRTEPGKEDWKRYHDASVIAGEAEFEQLAAAAKKTGAFWFSPTIVISTEAPLTIISAVFKKNVITATKIIRKM